MKTRKKQNRLYTPLNRLVGMTFTPGTLLFIRMPDDEFEIYQTVEHQGVFPSLSERISAMTLHCREATMGLCGQAWSVWDGKTWEHHEARRDGITQSILEIPDELPWNPVKTRQQRVASLFGDEEENCTCPGPEGVVAFNCPDHGCIVPPGFDNTPAVIPPKKTAADLF